MDWILWVAGVVVLASSSASAHGGRLDRYGCHHNRKTGDYHCHRGAAPPVAVKTQGKKRGGQ